MILVVSYGMFLSFEQKHKVSSILMYHLKFLLNMLFCMSHGAMDYVSAYGADDCRFESFIET